MVSPYKFQVYGSKTPIFVDVSRVGTLKLIKDNQGKHPPKLLRTENDMTKEADSKGGPGGQEKESKGGPGGVEMCLRWMCFAPRRLLFSWCFKSPPHTVFLCFCVLCFGTCSRPAFSGPPRPLPRKMGLRGPKNRPFFGPPFPAQKKRKNAPRRTRIGMFWGLLSPLWISWAALGSPNHTFREF